MPGLCYKQKQELSVCKFLKENKMLTKVITIFGVCTILVNSVMGMQIELSGGNDGNNSDEELSNSESITSDSLNKHLEQVKKDHNYEQEKINYLKKQSYKLNNSHASEYNTLLQKLADIIIDQIIRQDGNINFDEIYEILSVLESFEPSNVKQDLSIYFNWLNKACNMFENVNNEEIIRSIRNKIANINSIYKYDYKYDGKVGHSSWAKIGLISVGVPFTIIAGYHIVRSNESSKIIDELTKDNIDLSEKLARASELAFKLTAETTYQAAILASQKSAEDLIEREAVAVLVGGAIAIIFAAPVALPAAMAWVAFGWANGFGTNAS